MLQEQGAFDLEKATASLMALDVRKVKCPKTIDAAMTADAPTLGTVKKYHSEQLAIDAVSEIIAEGAALLNIGKNLQPHQIEYLSAEILQDYYWLNLADMRMIMKHGVSGKFGEIYDRLDVQVVLGWLTKYATIRMEVAEGRSQRQHIEAVTDNAKPMPQWFSDFAAQIEAKHDPKKGKVNFVPDAAFWEMVEQEHSELTEQVDLEKFKSLRLAQTKALFSR